MIHVCGADRRCILYGDVNFNFDLRGLQRNQKVLLTHGDSLDRVGNGFIVIGSSGSIIAAISNEQANIYGVQFHPEVDLTVNGKTMLKNFCFEVAGLTPTYTLRSREIQCIDYIRDIVKDNKVLVSCCLRDFNTFLIGGW